MKTRYLLSLFALLWAIAPAAHAADACPNRGELDAMYCDANKDMVADVPTDPKKWKNPSTIVFTYTPVEDPAVYENIFKPFTTHLAACLDKKVVFYQVRALGPWGEEIIKRFVREAIDEALKLESALARLRNDRLVVLVHYAPIQGTVEGEPLDIYPFLGCSRLEDPITRFPVSAVFHGHAHHGAPEGRTRTGVPVYNVSASLMREVFPERPFRIVDLSAGQSAAASERRAGDRRAIAEVH